MSDLSFQVDPARIIKRLQASNSDLTQQNVMLQAAFEQIQDELNELQAKYQQLQQEVSDRAAPTETES